MVILRWGLLSKYYSNEDWVRLRPHRFKMRFCHVLHEHPSNPSNCLIYSSVNICRVISTFWYIQHYTYIDIGFNIIFSNGYCYNFNFDGCISCHLSQNVACVRLCNQRQLIVHTTFIEMSGDKITDTPSDFNTIEGIQSIPKLIVNCFENFERSLKDTKKIKLDETHTTTSTLGLVLIMIGLKLKKKMYVKN